jgi:murein DD-endopeptidase MepM/ murein hydrolase activator NlpD
MTYKIARKLMKEPLYIYNPKTCGYEPARVTAKSVLGKVFSLLMVSLALVALFAFVHNKAFTSAKEETLLRENEQLEKYRAIVSTQLNQTRQELQKLEKREANLQGQLLFGSALLTNSEPAKVRELTVEFQKDYSDILKNTNQLLKQANADDLHFGSFGLFSNAFENIPTLLPIPFSSVLSVAGFGTKKHPLHAANHEHTGVDFACTEGTTVTAVASGVVESVRKNELQAGEGNTLVINHQNGFKSFYSHLGEIRVRSGQVVKKGAVIAVNGNTGTSSLPHIHFEILKNGSPINPVNYFMQGLSSTDYSLLLKQIEAQPTSMD